MAEIIKLVANDNLPQVLLTLTDDTTGLPIDVSAATVSVKFRAQGSTVILSTLACTNQNTGADGKVLLNFPGTSLAVAAGMYEGEIEINYGGSIQTVYDILKFKVRSDF